MCLIIEPVYSCEGSSTSIVDQVKVGKNNRVIWVKVILDTYTVTQQDGILHGRGDITFGQDLSLLLQDDTKKIPIFEKSKKGGAKDGEGNEEVCSGR